MRNIFILHERLIKIYGWNKKWIWKEYYINGVLKYHGEYQDGKYNGKGKEYDYFGRLIFEGEYVNNKKMNGIIYKYKNNDFSKYSFQTKLDINNINFFSAFYKHFSPFKYSPS